MLPWSTISYSNSPEQNILPGHFSSGLAAGLTQGHVQSNLTQLTSVQVSIMKPKSRVWAYKDSPTNQQLNPKIIQGGKVLVDFDSQAN